MKQEDIVHMAREAGFFINDNGGIESPLMEDYAIDEFLERFAVLVAAHEREACANICDGLEETHIHMNQFGSAKTADCLSQAIRARGEK